MTKNYLTTLLVLVLTAFVMPQSVHAAGPAFTTIYAQGYMRDASGAAVGASSTTNLTATITVKTVTPNATIKTLAGQTIAVTKGFFSHAIALNSTEMSSVTGGTLVVTIDTTIGGVAASFDVLAGTVPMALIADLANGVVAGGVTTAMIADGAITNNKIPAAAISDSQLAATGTLPAWSGANLTNLPGANIVGHIPAASISSVHLSAASSISGTVTTSGNFTGTGTSAFDFSGSSGNFATSTGAVTLNGNTTVAAGKTLTLGDSSALVFPAGSISQATTADNISITNTAANKDIALHMNGTGALDLNNSRIKGVGPATAASDAVNKDYVDNATMNSATMYIFKEFLATGGAAAATITNAFGVVDTGMYAFGSAATAIVRSASIASTDLNHPGILQLYSNAAGQAAGIAFCGISASAGTVNAPSINFTGGVVTMEAMVRVPVLGTGATYRVGFGSAAVGTTAPTKKAYFEFVGAATGQWSHQSTGTGNATATVGNAFAANDWVKLKITVDAAASTITYQKDSDTAVVVSTAANIPVAADLLCPFVANVGTAASARNLDVDYVKITKTFTTPR